MDTTARIVLGLLVAASTAAAGMLVAVSKRARQERAVRDETMRRVRRRATLSGRWDPFDTSNRALLEYQRPQLKPWRATLRSVLAGAVVGVVAFVALPASTGDGKHGGPSSSALSTPAITVTVAPTVRATSTTDPARTPEPLPTTAASNSATPSPTESTFIPESLVISNTGGIGVWVRTACREDAQATLAWQEGQVVQTVEGGSPTCLGWRLVERQGVQSWVEEQYLQPASAR